MRERINLDWKKLKERQEQIDKEKENHIVLTRMQVSIQQPAIAQLLIKFPEDIKPPKDLENMFYSLKAAFNTGSKNHNIAKESEHHYVVTIQGVEKMYAWMEFFINKFRDRYELVYPGKKIIVCKSWPNYRS